MPEASANSENTPTVASTARKTRMYGSALPATQHHEAGRGADQECRDQQHQDDTAAARRAGAAIDRFARRRLSL